MTGFQWIVLIAIVQIIHFLGTWKLYEKAGRKPWEAIIPVYNAIVLMKIINRPTWWTLLLFIPIINLLMFPVVWIQTLSAFNKRSTLDAWLGVLTLGFYIYAINYNPNTQYVGNLEDDEKKETFVGSIVFAVIVATFVHTYFIQPFTIPSSSLEKSLLIGDFLFVSKFHYGARTPMTTVAAPMVHDTIPVVKVKSYLYDDANKDSWKNKLQLPYFRFPGFQKIENNDIVVFNWPRDTLYHMYKPADRRYDKPIDKKTNYVKRCVAIPGDKLQIIDGFVHINGKKLELPERAKPQYSYKLVLDPTTPIDLDHILDDLKVTDRYNYISQGRDTVGIAALTFENAEKLKTFPGIKAVDRVILKGRESGIFPDKLHDGADESKFAWSADNYGPITIPKEGVTIQLNKDNLPLYKTLIREYEHNTLDVKGNDIFINGKKANTYTFKQNYYWMMGDNRHNSLDARFFGFTPEDHIVGKPVFIWMSYDSNGKGFNKIRWDRLFTTVSGDGQPQSYFKNFLGFLAFYFVGEYFWKKRKANQS